MLKRCKDQKRAKLEDAVLAKLMEKGIDLQGPVKDIRNALKDCAAPNICIQAALDMRSRRQGQNL